MNLEPINIKLAVIAFGLAVLAMVLSLIYPYGLKEVNQPPNFIDVLTLAQTIKDREPVLLIDLRDKKKFGEFHLPTAINLSVNDAVSKIKGSSTPVVFYSGDDERSKQLWSLLPDPLKAKSKVLYGGVHDWYDRILYPSLPPKKIKGKLVKKIIELNNFYGGKVKFVGDSTILNYYEQDFSQKLWPAVYRSKKLFREGC